MQLPGNAGTDQPVRIRPALRAYRLNGTENIQIRLQGCARLSGSSLFTYGISAFPHVVHHDKQYRGNTDTHCSICCSPMYHIPCKRYHQTSPNVRKRASWHMRETNSNHVALPLNVNGIFVVRIKKPCILGIKNAPSEDSDETVRMHRLIWIFTGRTYSKVRFLTLRLQLPAFNFLGSGMTLTST